MADRELVMLTNLRIETCNICVLNGFITGPDLVVKSHGLGAAITVFHLLAVTGYLLQPDHGPLVPIGQGFIVPTHGSIPGRETCETFRIANYYILNLIWQRAYKLVDCFHVSAVAVDKLALQFG